MEEFEFSEELPKRSRPQITYVDPEKQKLADACRSRPGEWLKVPTSHYGHLHSPSTFAYSVRQGLNSSFRPAGDFDAKVRDGIIYMMYKGPTP